MNPNILNIILVLVLSGSLFSMIFMYNRFFYLRAPEKVLNKSLRNRIFGYHIFFSVAVGISAVKLLFNVSVYFEFASISIMVPLTTTIVIAMIQAWLVGPVIDRFLPLFHRGFKEWQKDKRGSN